MCLGSMSTVLGMESRSRADFNRPLTFPFSPIGILQGNRKAAHSLKSKKVMLLSDLCAFKNLQKIKLKKKD